MKDAKITPGEMIIEYKHVRLNVPPDEAQETTLNPDMLKRLREIIDGAIEDEIILGSIHRRPSWVDENEAFADAVEGQVLGYTDTLPEPKP